MAGGALASLVIKLGLDATGVEQGARKAEAALGGITTGKALTALKAGAAVAFAGAAKGALAMEDAAARFRAETGASAEEAQRFAEYVNAASGRTVLGLEQIADTATKVRTDLGLSGAEAEATASKFLAYERATNQGADAVLAFDDILDNWGLEASDAQAIMDKLIVSHQKYGGSIAENQKSLAQLAPAMKAANFEVDDAIALLGLFGSKGLDANQGAAAFAKALTKVESPQELQDLIDDISATEDPFERATKAADLFGARAGAKLANALGGVELRDFAIGMDDAAGATERAADAIDDTWTNKVRKALNYANSLLTGFAMNIGPLLTGALAGVNLLGAMGLDKAALGKVGDVLKGGLTRALAKVGLEEAGAAVASKFASAFAVALPIVGVAAIGAAIGVAIGKAIVGPEVERAMKEEAGKAGAALAGAQTLDELKRQKAVLEKGLADAEAVPFSNFLFGSSDQLRQQIADVDAKIASLTDAAAASATKAMGGAAGGVGGKPVVSVQAPEVRLRGKLGTGALRKAVESQAGGISAAWDTVSAAFNKGPKIQSLDSRMKEGRQALRRAMAQMRRAVKAGDPLAASYWADQYNKVEHSLHEMSSSAGDTMANVEQTMARGRKRFGRADKGITRDAGREARSRSKAAETESGKTADALPDALRGAKPETSTAAGAQAQAAKAPLANVAADAATWGGHMGQRYAAGLRASVPTVGSAAAAVAAAAAGPLKFSAPPRHGPLSSIRSWGPHMIEHWAKGTEGALGRVRGAASAWAKAATPSMSSGWQPAAAYAGGLGARSMRGGRPRGGDTHIHVGTLIANDSGVNELRRRMDRSARIRRRDRRVQDSPNAQAR